MRLVVCTRRIGVITDQLAIIQVSTEAHQSSGAVTVAVAVLGPPFLIVLTVYVDIKQH